MAVAVIPTYIAIQEHVKEPTHAETEEVEETEDESNDGEEEAIEANLTYNQ